MDFGVPSLGQPDVGHVSFAGSHPIFSRRSAIHHQSIWNRILSTLGCGQKWCGTVFHPVGELHTWECKEVWSTYVHSWLKIKPIPNSTLYWDISRFLGAHWQHERSRFGPWPVPITCCYSWLASMRVIVKTMCAFFDLQHGRIDFNFFWPIQQLHETGHAKTKFVRCVRLHSWDLPHDTWQYGFEPRTPCLWIRQTTERFSSLAPQRFAPKHLNMISSVRPLGLARIDLTQSTCGCFLK